MERSKDGQKEIMLEIIVITVIVVIITLVVCLVLKFCLSLLDITRLRTATRKLRDFPVSGD